MSVQYTYCSLGLFTLHTPATCTFITLKTQLHVLSNEFLTIWCYTQPFQFTL